MINWEHLKAQAELIGTGFAGDKRMVELVADRRVREEYEARTQMFDLMKRSGLMRLNTADTRTNEFRSPHIIF
jgi:hypothetical protein